ncbi:hypothetical protein BKI52_18770 [marine bacterium AO1-C]|nr:hypothetical protein BKI52_18770 [marine bacterium AO1-C]
MSKKQHLFLLIKSLSKAEKRYFKLFVANQKGSGAKNNNYLRLFDAIDQQEAYDEQAIKQKFAGQTFIKQLHVTKNYLNQLILKSLRNFHTKLSKEAELRDLLRDVEILFHKELYDQCRNTLDKAYQLATTYERLPALIEINDWKRRLCLATSLSINTQPHLDALVNENKAIVSKLDHLNHYWDWSVNLIARLSNAEEAPCFLENEWFKSADKADTIQAKKLYHHSLMAYYVMIEKDIEKGIEIVDQLIEILEERPEHIVEDLSAYLTLLNNKVGLLLDQKAYDIIPDVLHKIREAPAKYQIKELTAGNLKVHLHTYNVELEMYRDAQLHQQGIALIPAIEAFLEQHQSRVPQGYLLSLYYQFAYLYFKNQQCADSLKWLNKILNVRWDSSREDLETYARFLNLIIHFELGNILMMKYAVESCRRFLKKRKQVIKPFEKKLLGFFAKVCVSPPAEYPILFARLKQELFDAHTSQERSQHLDYLDFEAWIEEKCAKPR